MKLRQHEKIVATTIVFIVLTLPLSVFPASATTEHVCLTAKGESMYPTIRDGDSVTIQLCFDGSLINVGDIIVYSTIATGMNPGYMWIGHRVVEKYRKDDTWWFKTRGDNCSDPDRWEVPEYWLLGKVVRIDHVERAHVPTKPSPQPNYSHTTYPSASLPQGSETFLLIIGSFCLGAAIAVFNHLRRRRNHRKHSPNPDQSTRIHLPRYHRELASKHKKIWSMREIQRLRQLSSMRRITKEDGETLVKKWRNSIMGLMKLADKNLKAAKGHLESKHHKLTVEAASAAVENMARALIHCYGGKPDPDPGQEEPLRMLSGRFKGEEKAEFERAIYNVTCINHTKIVQRHMSKHKVQIQLLGETKAKEILESASNVVDLFKRILIDHFATEIPELQYEACPKCRSLDIWISVFDQFIVNYQCITCRCKWTGPRRYIKP